MTTTSEARQRQIEIARAAAPRVRVDVRITVTNPRPEARETLGKAMRNNAFIHQWPGCVNPKLARRLRLVPLKWFSGIARVFSDGEAVSVDASASEIPPGSRPDFKIQILSA